MKEYVKQTFKDLDLRRGVVFSDASFERCVFDGCGVRPGRGPYGVVRNVVARKCKYAGDPMHTILEDVTIEDLDTGGALLLFSDCLFKHVVLKGKFDKWFVTDPSGKPGTIDAKEYYASVDWALDIREAEFRSLDLRGIPADRLRRNHEIQIAVYREDALGTEGWMDLPDRGWRNSLRRLTAERPLWTEMLLIPEKRGKNYETQVASAKMLHDLGLAK